MDEQDARAGTGQEEEMRGAADPAERTEATADVGVTLNLLVLTSGEGLGGEGPVLPD